VALTERRQGKQDRTDRRKKKEDEGEGDSNPRRRVWD
jgi:hypothetical protein